MSDVLIKDMEMPESCDKCKIMVFEDTNCLPELFCGCPIVFKAHPQGVGHRPDYCPLIEIPHHGRLIDADALLNLLNHCIFPSDMVTTTALSMAVNWIKEAPTVIQTDGGET